MEAARSLRLVSDDDPRFEWPDGNGELLTIEQAVERVKGLLHENDGLTTLTKKQARENSRLQRRVAEDEDPMNHARGADIVALFKRWQIGANHPKRREISELIDYWKQQTGHTNSRNSKDRFDLVRARLKDGYDFPTLRLAIDVLAALPYVVNAQRRSEGKPSQRYDQLTHALKSGEKVEQFANLGHQARRQHEG